MGFDTLTHFVVVFTVQCLREVVASSIEFTAVHMLSCDTQDHSVSNS